MRRKDANIYVRYTQSEGGNLFQINWRNMIILYICCKNLYQNQNDENTEKS